MSRRVPAALFAAGLLFACGGNTQSSPSTTPTTAEAELGEDSVESTTTTTTISTTTSAPAAEGGAVDRADPCSLLTAQDASDLTGVDFGPGQNEPFEAGTACIYIDGTSVVGVQVYSAPGTEELLAANAPLFALDAAPIDGIGEAAYFSESEASIGVLQDGLIFSITIAIDAQPAPRDTVLAAAEVVLERIG